MHVKQPLQTKNLQKTAYLIVNFGGPRTLTEIEPFLRALLSDQDVVRSGMPQLIHNVFFGKIAKKRALKITDQYAEIGGRSPIFEDTEAIAFSLRTRLQAEVITFHRYLPSTHAETFEKLESLQADEIIVFPMFPQFTYATTGSIARLFYKELPSSLMTKLRWVKSYPTHPAFVHLVQKRIEHFLTINQLKQEEVVLLFSAHGLPLKFVENGDLYEIECNGSFQKIMAAFPKALGRLAYQSKFGPGEWLRPYTIEVCEEIRGWHEGREHVLFVPISFTSDHIETLFEIEKEYLPVIVDQGLKAYRLPAFNRDEDWIEAIQKILEDSVSVTTPMLVRWFKS